MAGGAAAGGVRAWSVFGTIGVRGLGGAVSQLLAFNRAGKATAAIAKTITGTFATLAKTVGAVSLAIGGIAVASTKSFASFDQAMTRSLAIMGDVSESMRQDMVASARRIGRQTEFSATQAGEAYFFLASAGLDAKQSIEALPAVTQFATAGQFDLATATDLLTDAQTALGMSSEDATENLENMTRVSDTLVKANTLANASVEQFSQALTNKFAGRLRAMNVPLEEGVALLAAFASQGIKGRRAGQQATIVLRDLSKAANENEEAFEDLGVKVFDVNGELRPLHQIIGDLESALGDMSTQERIAALETTGLQKRAADALNILLGTSEATEEWTEALAEAAGTADEVAGKQRSSWMMAWNRFKGAINDAAIALGAEFAPVFREIAEDITRWINQQDFQKLAKQVKSATEDIVTFVVQSLGTLGRKLVQFARTGQNMMAVLRGTWLGDVLGMEETQRSKTAGVIRDAKARLEDLEQQLEAVTAKGAEAERLQRILPVEGIGRDAEEIRQEMRELEAWLVEKQQQLAMMGPSFEGAEGVFEGMEEFELNLPDAIGAGSGATDGDGGGDPRRFFNMMGIAIPTPSFIAQLARKRLEAAGNLLSQQREIPFQAKVTVPDTALPSLQRDLQGAAEEAADKAAGEAEPQFASEGKRLGKSLVQGIISGSFELEDFLKRAITTILSTALFGPGGVFGFLGIGSPAKATVPIGEAMVMGVVKGLHRTTPMLRTAMNRAFSARRTFNSGIRLAGAGGGALSRAQTTSSFTPEARPAVSFDFSEFPEPKTPMHQQRDREWQRWLRRQSDIAKSEGYRFESR